MAKTADSSGVGVEGLRPAWALDGDDSHTPNEKGVDERGLSSFPGLQNAIRLRQEAERLQARFQDNRGASTPIAMKSSTMCHLLEMVQDLKMRNALLEKLASSRLDSRSDSEAMQKLKAENEFLRRVVRALILKQQVGESSILRKRARDDEDDEVRAEEEEADDAHSDSGNLQPLAKRPRMTTVLKE